MSDFTPHQISMISHLDSKISNLYERFFLNPFQFFGEMEIHYTFTENLQNLLGNDRKWKGAKIIREVASVDRYKRNINKELVLNNNGRRAYIDIILKHPELTIGFEFYFKKETKPVEIEYKNRYYLFRKCNVSPKYTKTHTKNDLLKLNRQKDLDLRYIIIFIAGFSNNKKDYEYFIERKRNKILDEIENLSNLKEKKIRILYCERFCIGNLEGTHNRYMKQFGH